MKVLLSYHWNNMPCNVLDTNNRGISPRTKQVVRDIDYDYYKSVSYDDIIDYLTPNVLRENESEIYHRAIRHTLTNLNDYIDFDSLGEDEYFVEYLKDKYEQEALESWEEENEELI